MCESSPRTRRRVQYNELEKTTIKIKFNSLEVDVFRDLAYGRGTFEQSVNNLLANTR